MKTPLREQTTESIIHIASCPPHRKWRIKFISISTTRPLIDQCLLEHDQLHHHFFAYLAAIDITTGLQTDSSLALRIIPLSSNPVSTFRVSVSGRGYSKECVTPDNSTNLVCNFDDLPSATRLDLHGQPWNAVGSTEQLQRVRTTFSFDTNCTFLQYKNILSFNHSWRPSSKALQKTFNRGLNSSPLLRARQTAPPLRGNEFFVCFLHKSKQLPLKISSQHQCSEPRQRNP